MNMNPAVVEVSALVAAWWVARGKEMAWKLARSTGKAARIAGTTFLVLGLPLVIAMDREQQADEIDAA
ncbi:hypothetical protein ACP4OV_014969 [Aristida adscensionis]